MEKETIIEYDKIIRPNTDQTELICLNEFVPIKNYETRYLINKDGNIFSIYRNKFIVQSPRGPYLKAHLWLNGKVKQMSIHRLVAEAFLSNPNNLPVINHKDNDPHNNNVDNLEWCTQKDNVNHSWNSGRKPNITREVPVIQLDKSGNVLNYYRSISEASRKTGIHIPNISFVLLGKGKTAGGYKWKIAM